MNKDRHDPNIRNLTYGLTSNDPEKQIDALDKALMVVKDIVKTAISGLENQNTQLFVAERLIRFGSIIIEPLEKLLVSTEKVETKIVISLILLQLGNKVGLPHLMQAIENSEEYAGLVSIRLAQAQITEVTDKIIAHLDKISITDVDMKKADLIVTMLSALKILKIQLPNRLKEKFSQHGILWQVRTMITENKT